MAGDGSTIGSAAPHAQRWRFRALSLIDASGEPARLPPPGVIRFFLIIFGVIVVAAGVDGDACNRFGARKLLTISIPARFSALVADGGASIGLKRCAKPACAGEERKVFEEGVDG